MYMFITSNDDYFEWSDIIIGLLFYLEFLSNRDDLKCNKNIMSNVYIELMYKA